MPALANRRGSRTLAWMALLLAAAYASPAMATTDHKPHKAKKVKVAKSPVPYDSGSGESRQDRERRLLRECKGRVNAGACAGYTGG